MNRWRRWMLVLVIATLAGGVAACGQKGPLYLPDEKPRQDGQG